MQTLTKSRIITCLLPKGSARSIAKNLWLEKNITVVNEQDARRITTLTVDSGQTLTLENEVLTVVVPDEIAEDIFTYIYEMAQLEQNPLGVIYLSTAMASTVFHLPNLPIED